MHQQVMHVKKDRLMSFQNRAAEKTAKLAFLWILFHKGSPHAQAQCAV